MNEKIQKSMPVALSVVGSLGVVATAVLAVTETLKNSEELKEVYKNKNNIKEKILTSLKIYWPSIVTATATIASITTGTIISKKYEASLGATAVMLDGIYRKYKGKVKQVLGNDVDKKINEEIAKDDFKEHKEDPKLKTGEGEVLYWEEHIGFFVAKPENLAKAFMLTCERLIRTNFYENGIETDCWSSFRVLLSDAKAKCVDEDVDDISFDYGWHYEYVKDAYYGDMFIHYETVPEYDENGVVKYMRLIIDKDPVFNVPSDPYRLSGGYDVSQIDEFNDEDKYEEEKRLEKEVEING